jgi:ABC-type lipoprotein release transport system permease subunit
MSMPLVYYLQVKPLKIAMIGQEAADAYEKFGLQDSLPAAFDLNIFFTQAFIIFLLTSILAIYPWWKISSSRSIDMMRNG